MSVNVKTKHTRLLDGKNIKINKVFNAYRSGGLEVDGKFVGKSFVYFPKDPTLPDVLLSGDERVKESTATEKELREKNWDKENRTFTFTRYKGKLDREFFSTYKKVFDVEVTLGESVEIPVWDGVAKMEVATVFNKGEVLLLNAFSASKLKAMIEDLDLDSGIQLVKGKDKAGNEAMVKPFDWEDEYKSKLENKFVVIRVKGEGMDTKYKFKEGTPFELAKDSDEVNLENIPF